MVPGTAKEVPYKSDEVAPPMAERASQSNNIGNMCSKTDGKGNARTNIAEDEESSDQLALIPMHPASKKSDAKQLPIVLGRTNLASWWWKSCPCQHYCRLHCRPVAQNIRSLSKVMVQIDTEGRVHIVGKNPHLIAITPEREDNILHVNDIICIGRSDREPWMRFKVVQKPDDHHNTALAAGTCQNHAVSAPLVSGALNSGKGTGQTSSRPPVDNIHNNPAPLADAQLVSNPPEWITTNTRKRKTSSQGTSDSNTKNMTSNRSLNNSTMSGQIAQRQLQHLSETFRLSKKARPEASGTASTRARAQRSHGKTIPQGETMTASFPAAAEPVQKRRRRSLETPLKHNSTNESSHRRSYRVSGIRKNEGEPSSDKPGNGTPMHSDTRKRERTYVHLVFQDYQTSASLLKGNELRRKSESSINQATSRASRAESVVRQHQYGRTAPPRAFVADKSPLDLASKNCAAALVGAVSTGHAPEEIAVPMTQPIPTVKSYGDKQSTLKPEFEKVVNRTRNRLLLPPSDELEQVPACDKNERLFESTVRPKCMDNEQDMAIQESSMLSLPLCASSSFENGQGDATQLRQSSTLPVGYEAGPMMGPVGRAGSNNETKMTTDDPAASFLTCDDPVVDLRPWQEMVEQEERKGNTTSFRHALASLVIAKNAERTKQEEERGHLWLPPLLGEDFDLQLDTY